MLLPQSCFSAKKRADDVDDNDDDDNDDGNN